MVLFQYINHVKCALELNKAVYIRKHSLATPDVGVSTDIPSSAACIGEQRSFCGRLPGRAALSEPLLFV